MRGRQLAAILALSVVLAGGIITAVVITAKRQAAGRAARERQIQVFPVVCDLYADGYRRGVLTLYDLGVVLENAPTSCPALEAIMHRATG